MKRMEFFVSMYFSFYGAKFILDNKFWDEVIQYEKINTFQ